MQSDQPSIELAPAPASSAGPPERARIAGLLSARQLTLATVLFFLLVASLRLSLIYFFGFDSPYSDQWDAEGWTWLRPYQEGHIDWRTLFAPHNEHRIAWARLVSLALFALNNEQWDNLVSATLNVFLVATACALVFRKMLKLLAPIMWPVPVFLLAACCLPCGHENLLIGFQIEFYLLVMLTVLGVWLAATRPTSVAGTIVLGALAFASIFTLASALFTPVAIAGAAALRVREKGESWLRALPLFAILASATVTGILLLVNVPSTLRAGDIYEWLAALRVVASWPLPASWLAVALLWSPLLVGGMAMMRRRGADGSAICALVIGAWTAAQIASISYGRAHDLNYVHSRYTDILALTVFVNTFFCLRLLGSSREPAQARTRVLLASLWLTAIAGGYAVQGVIGLKEMQDFAASRQMQSDNVRSYVRGWDRSIIETAMPWNLPYPNKPRLKMMLDDKTIRQMLPAGTRTPIPLGASDGGFNPNGLPDSFPRAQGRGVYGSYEFGRGNDNTARKSANGLHSRFPYLLFYVAGDMGQEGITLALQAADGTAPRLIGSGSAASASWREVVVATPANDFSVQARDESHAHWFAFTPPLELGRLSAWTHRLLEISPLLLLIWLLTAGFALLFSCMLRLHAMDLRGSEAHLQADSVT